ncbi:MAG TPA: aminodeoxychorismate/anthranilate synthase component II [Phycisphaerae bacterium]|jgi:anthranilate synthase/aminodeoxychorismate synthase-like glutamine amidotransferase
MVLIIDNYDSFTWNLVQAIGVLRPERPIEVQRNDRITLEQIAQRRPSHLIISPGPCTPNEGGISLEVVRHFAGRVPILGVCLGHQCIVQALGGHIVRAARVMHGKTSTIHHDGAGIFTGLPSPLTAMRYHSLVAEEATLPSALRVSARSESGEIMGVRHRTLALEGVQFHPESFLTEHGAKLLANFLAINPQSAIRNPQCSGFGCGQQR